MGEIEGCKNNHVLVKLEFRKKMKVLIKSQQTFPVLGQIVNSLAFMRTWLVTSAIVA